MGNLEESLDRVWDNVGKIDQQIEMTIQKLCGDKILEQVEFFPIAGIDKKPGTQTKTVEANQMRCKPGPKCSKSGGFLSSKKFKRVESMEVEVVEFDSTSNRSFKLNEQSSENKIRVFTAIDEDTFLSPVMDRWVFGAAFINASSTTQKLPVVILNLLDKDNAESKSFSYGYKTGLLDLESEDFLGDSQTLPVQEVFKNKEKTVQPGCKFFVSASFSQPILADYDREASLLVSLMCDDKLMWSVCLPLNLHKSAGLDNDRILNRFQERIFVELSEYTYEFSVSNLPSPVFPLKEFLTEDLGLSSIKTVKTRFDTNTNYFASKNLNSLWGLLLLVQTCERTPDRFLGIVFCRSVEQLDYFLKSFSKWLDQQKERNPTLQSNVKQNQSLSEVTKSMQDEIKTLIHFIYMQDQSSKHKDKDPPNVSCDKQTVMNKWLEKYIQDMNSTDAKFL